MKFSILSFILLLSLNSFATNYYVDASTTATTQNGSQTNPWKTLSQVQSNMSSFRAGDIISFKKSGTYSGQFNVSCSGTAGNPIVFNSYGSGNAPVFSGTGSRITYLVYVNNRSYVTFDGLNITDPTLSPTDRTQQSKIERAFYLDGSSNNIVIKNCSISLAGVGVYFVGGNNTLDNCTIQNLRMVVNTNDGGYDDYGANPVVISSSNNTLTNNRFLDCWANSYDFSYDGGAVEFFGPNTNNNFIGYNTMSNNNGLVEFGSSNGGSSTGNKFVYNKLINNGSLFYINNSGPFAITVSNLQFYNNVIVETVSQRLRESYLGSMASSSSASGIVLMKNNIFWLTTGIDVARSGQLTGSQLVHEDNIYKLGSGSVLNFTAGSTELTTTSSIFSDAAAADPLQWNFAPATGSVAIDFGQNVGLARDFAGNTVPALPNAGILESGGGGTGSTLNATATAGNIACKAGTTTVVVTATGGTPPYTGTGTFTVSAGTYSYTVNDASGASKTVSVTVSDPAAITVTLTGGTIASPGGTTTITVTASGGSGSGYTYKLNSGAYQSSNIFTAVPAGTQAVTVKDANGCTASKNITLTVGGSSALVISAVAGTIACNGGNTTVTMSATGGVPPYTGTGTFTVTAGTYTYTVRDAAGTTQTTSITVTQPAALTASLSNGSIPVVGGTTSINVTASGGTAPYSYKLNNGSFQTGNIFTGILAGTYSITIKDAKACTITKSITVTQPGAGGTLSLSLVRSTNISCKGKRDGTIRVQANGGVGPYLYRTPWVPYSSDNYFTNLMPGNYLVTVKDSRGVTATLNVTIQNSTLNCGSTTARSFDNAGETMVSFEVKAYPNPSTNQFTIDLQSPAADEVLIEVMDLNGRRVFQAKGLPGKKFVFGENFRAGTYFVKVTQGTNVKTEKIIKLN